MTKPVFRFAPSTNGELHLGHAYSALLNQKMARESNGQLLLRIEDIDTGRCTPELEAKMLEDLEWLGLEWDDVPRRQSEHFEEYKHGLEKLDALGLIYPSTLSRSEIKQTIATFEENTGGFWPRDPDGAPIYPGKERELDQCALKKILKSGEQFSLRLDTKKAIKHIGKQLVWLETGSGRFETITAMPSLWGDVVMARKDTPTSYHIACTLDDAFQGITHIVRGEDLFHATAIHRLLQTLLDLPEPTYHHHKLIRDKTGRKLSKSEKDTSIRSLREAGVTQADIRKKLGFSVD